MSWQTYIDDKLIGAGCAHAAIIGFDGNTWATSAGFGLKPGEGKKLVEQYDSPGDAFTAGVHIGGTYYLAIKADNSSIYGKKGAGGVITAKTGQSVIISIYNETLQPGKAVGIVEKLADYLKDNGY